MHGMGNGVFMYNTKNLIKEASFLSEILKEELGLQFDQNHITLNLKYIGSKLNMHVNITVFDSIFEICIEYTYSKTDKENCIVEVESISSLLDILKHNVLNNMGK